MLKQLCLISTLFLVTAATAQQSAPPAPAAINTTMQLPPPISSIGLPAQIGARERSNYLEGGIRVTGGYVNNLYPGNSSRTLDDGIFTLQPQVSFDRTTGRLHEDLSYTPSFDFYTPDTSLDTIDHNAKVGFQYRFTPNVTLLADDTVAKTSDTLGEPLSFNSLSGSLPTSTPGFIIPFLPQISNSANVELASQLSPTSMFGLGGNSTLLHYTSPSLSQGLYNSNARSGFAFYTQRFSLRQYLGGLYQYSLIVATPVAKNGAAQADLTAHSVLGFYTAYPQPKLSISLGLGLQHYRLTQGPAAPIRAWTPIALASVGWQVQRASFALSYSRVVTEGQGIVGAYTSNSATASGQWQFSRDWSAGINGDYAQLTPVTHSLAFSTLGGHTLSLGGSVHRQLGPNLTLSIQYQHLHQTYDGIPAIAANPNSSQETASIYYHFSRPVGM